MPRLPAAAMLLGFALASAATTAAHAQLTDTEQRLVAAVKSRSPAALALLERTVRVNSGTMNTAGVREVGRILRAELDDLGFETRWAEMPVGMKRAGHLVATRKGDHGRRVLLIGHLDTVFEAESTVAAWDPAGVRVRGQGVSDMKGGDVILIEALRAMKAAGVLDGTTISVIFTGDEERVGSPRELARADMVELAKASDLALAFEASARSREGGHMASYARRSAGGWTLKVTGRPGHSGGVFSRNSGYGAIYEAVRIVDEFRRELQEPNLTFNPGTIIGGTDAKYDPDTATGSAFGKNNVIAREAEVRGDLRYLTPEQGERARSRMREIVSRSLPHTQATITFTETYPPQAPTEAGAQLLEAFSKASLDAGLGPIRAMDPAFRGAGDVQFVAPYIPAVDGLGATGSGAHTDFEDLEIASIERGAIRAAILIYRLTR
ncbi:MAG TPA: M20/M25/M40 family metallo-hydrolase [Usitatibacter sp.]|nr:M20/M25/M40 family metallo-hydrolase [Usitatibacter sp.]